MSNQIRLKRGSGSDPSASDLVVGEVALRTDNGKLFTKKDDNSIAEIGTGLSDGDKGDITISNSGATFTIDNGAVTSAKILDGTITNADINASAAIAGSKISPTFTSDIRVQNTSPQLFLEDSNNNSDYSVENEDGTFRIRDTTNVAVRMTINSSGTAAFSGNLDVGAGLDVTGGLTASAASTFNEDVTFTGANYNLAWDKSDNQLEFADNARATFGGSNDLSIYHVGGNHSFIKNLTNNLIIQTPNRVEIGSTETDGSATEISAKFIRNGSVELYEDNVLKAETTSDGFNVEGTLHANGIDMDDNHKIKLGLGDDLEIYHDGSHSYIQDTGTGHLKILGSTIQLGKSDNSELGLTFSSDGSIQLRFDNSTKFETTSAGAQIFSNLEIGNTSAPFLLESTTSGNGLEDIGRIGINRTNSSTSDRQMWLQYTVGASISQAAFQARQANDTGTAGTYLKVDAANNNVDLPRDNLKLRLGSSQDLQIYHDGTHSYIANSTGNLYVNVPTFFHLGVSNGGEKYLTATENGAVELFFDNSKKFETLTDGVKISGKTLSLINPANFQDSTFTLEHGSSTVGNKHTIDFKDQNGSSAQIISYGSAMGSGLDNALQIKTSTTSNGNPATRLTFFEDGKIQLPDNGKATFGTSDDLQIYHDGTNSNIDNATNELRIESLSKIRFNTNEFIVFKGNLTEATFRAVGDGANYLYFDGSVKFETTSAGVLAQGHFFVNDNNKFIAGTSNDLQIFHDGSNSFVRNSTGGLDLNSDTIHLRNGANNETYARCLANGAAELYHDNVKRLETKSNGVEIFGFLSAKASSDTVAQFVHESSGNTVGVVMRHGRGGLSGFSGKMISFRGNDNTEEGSIVIGTTTTAYNTTSDYRLKENETSILTPITKLKTLKPYTFNFKKDPGVKVDGFFAHEVSSVVPVAVTGIKDEVDKNSNPVYQGIDQSKLVPLITAALQEAIAKIEVLETEVAALKAG